MYYSDASSRYAECGCRIQIFTEVESPACRCGGGCWDDEYEFTYDIQILDPCPSHDAAGATLALEG